MTARDAARERDRGRPWAPSQGLTIPRPASVPARPSRQGRCGGPTGGQPNVYPEQSGQRPAQWLADQIGERLGSVESYDYGHTFYAACEAVYPGTLTEAQGPGGALLSTIRMELARTGATRRQRTLTAAGHAYGFADDELAEAARLLGVG